MSSHQYGEESAAAAAAAVAHYSTSTQIDTLLRNENFHISSVQAMLLNPEASNDSTDVRIAELSELFDPTENTTDDMNLQSTTTAKETLFQKVIKNNKKRCSMGEPTNITNIGQYDGSAFWTLACSQRSSLESSLSVVEKVLSDLDQEYLMGKTDTNTTTLGSTSQPSIALQLLRSLFFAETNIQPTEAMSINCEQRMIQRVSSSKVLDVTNIRKLFSREDYENEKFYPSDKSISPKVWLLFDKLLRICSVSVKGNIPEHIRKKQGRMLGAMKGKGVNNIALICSLCGGHDDDGLLVKGGVYQPKLLEGLYDYMSNWHTTHYPNCPCKNNLSEQDLHTLTSKENRYADTKAWIPRLFNLKGYENQSSGGVVYTGNAKRSATDEALGGKKKKHKACSDVEVKVAGV